MRRRLWPILLLCLGAAVSAQERFRPARYAGGPLPAVPVLAVGPGEVLLELAVTKSGSVAAVKTLRTTPPFTEAFVDAARAWRFRPAEELTERPDRSGPRAWTPVDSTVLVGGVFRAPTLNAPTLGQSPKDVGTEADSTPYPLGVVSPPYPPRARGDGSVLVEVLVDAGGGVSNARVLLSSPAFDDLALTTARAWTFRPARVKGERVGVYAYLVFAFRQPVVR